MFGLVECRSHRCDRCLDQIWLAMPVYGARIQPGILLAEAARFSCEIVRNDGRRQGDVASTILSSEKLTNLKHRKPVARGHVVGVWQKSYGEFTL